MNEECTNVALSYDLVVNKYSCVNHKYFSSEEEAWEWYDKVEELASSLDNGLIIANGTILKW